MDVGRCVWRELAAPRCLSEDEQQLAQALAAATGNEHLTAQVEQARVVAECRCGCPSLRLATSGPALSSQAVRRLSSSSREHVSVSATWPDRTGAAADVSLHIVAGLIEELEVFAGEGVPVAAASHRHPRDHRLVSGTGAQAELQPD